MYMLNSSYFCSQYNVCAREFLSRSLSLFSFAVVSISVIVTVAHCGFMAIEKDKSEPHNTIWLYLKWNILDGKREKRKWLHSSQSYTRNTFGRLSNQKRERKGQKERAFISGYKLNCNSGASTRGYNWDRYLDLYVIHEERSRILKCTRADKRKFVRKQIHNRETERNRGEWKGTHVCRTRKNRIFSSPFSFSILFSPIFFSSAPISYSIMIHEFCQKKPTNKSAIACNYK